MNPIKPQNVWYYNIVFSDEMLTMSEPLSTALAAVAAQQTATAVAANTTVPRAMSSVALNVPPLFQAMSYSTVVDQDGRSQLAINELPDTGTPSRRVYVRQDFTHENAASADVVNGAAKRYTLSSTAKKKETSQMFLSNSLFSRERTSKMKYQEPENEQLRRRRRDKSVSEAGGTASSATTHSQTPSMLAMPGQTVKQSSSIHSTLTPMPSTSVSGMHARSAAHDGTANLPDSPTRRQQQQQSIVQQQQQHSSAAGGGVISASLQLSVQLPTADTPQPLNLAADLPDIPYIEDYGSDIGEFGELIL